MEIKVALCTGFCFGVKRAIKLAESELAKSKVVYSWGPIIHNPQVVEKLSSQGLKIVKDIDSAKDGVLLIPSHGIEPSLMKKACQKGLRLVNATCPFVTKSQELAEILSRDDYKVLIIGDKTHPEIKALVGYARGKADIISGLEEAKKLNLKNKKLSVIAQTTQSEKRFLEIIAVLLGKASRELRIFNTICNETIKRQESTRELAKEVEVMLVIGGRNSANTSILVKICNEFKHNVYHIEDKRELKPEWFINKRSVGISSGASTPDWIVQEVVDQLEKIKPLKEAVVRK